MSGTVKHEFEAALLNDHISPLETCTQGGLMKKHYSMIFVVSSSTLKWDIFEGHFFSRWGGRGKCRFFRDKHLVTELWTKVGEFTLSDHTVDGSEIRLTTWDVFETM